MKTTPRGIDWCVSLLVLASIGCTSACLSAEPGSQTWQPEGLKRVYGTENGHHWGQVHALDFGPDGKWIVSAGDKNVFVWETETLKPLAFAHGLPDSAKSISTHPDGKRIAVATRDQVLIYEFDGEKLTELQRLTGYSKLTGVRYTSDGSKLIVVSGWQTFLYDVTGKHPIETRVFRMGGWFFDVSSDGGRLALVNQGTLTLWDVSKPKSQKLAEQENDFMTVAISPDGQTIATAEHTDPRVSLWAFEEDQLKKQVEWWNEVSGRVLAMRFSPDNKSLFARSHHAIRTWDIHGTPKNVSTVTCSYGTAFSTHGSRLAVGEDLAVRIWELGDESTEVSPPIEVFDQLAGFWYADDGRLLAEALTRIESPDVKREIAWKRFPVDLSNGKQLQQAPPDSKKEVDVVAAARYDISSFYSPAGNRKADLKRATTDTSLPDYVQIDPVFLDGESASSVVLRGQFSTMAWSHDGQQIVTGNEKNLQCWDSVSGDLIKETSVEGECAANHFVPNGKIMSLQQKRTELADYDKHFVVWNPEDDAITALQFPDRDKIDNARISRKGNFLALRKRGGPIRIYHFDGEQLFRLCELNVDAQYFMCDFSPDGKLLALNAWGAKKDLVGLFDSRTGRKVKEWKPLGITDKVRFSPDGSELALLNGNGTVYVLGVPPNAEMTFTPKKLAVEAQPIVEFKPPEDDADIRARFEKLFAESEAAAAKWRNPPNNRKGQPPYLRFAEQFMKLGKPVVETASGRDALVQVCRASLISGYEDDNARITKLHQVAARLLGEHHFLDPKVLPAVEIMCYRTEDVRGTARRLIRESQDPLIQARASLALARHYQGQLRMRSGNSRDKELTIGLFQRIIDNYEGLHFWEGGPLYSEVAEKNIKRLQAK